MKNESDNHKLRIEMMKRLRSNILFSKNAKNAYWHARIDVKGRVDPELEAVIAANAEYSYLYAGFIKGRFPEGEAAIATSAYYAVNYARDVIEGRFPEGEAVIAKDAWWAAKYQEFLETL